MNHEHESYWPSDFGVEPQITPLTILKEQAALLGERTKNLVEAKVQTKLEEKMEFRHMLYLSVPTLGNYRYFLLSASHKPETYPVSVYDATHDSFHEVWNIDQFKDKLKEILSSERVRDIVGNLLAYAQEANVAV